VNTANAQDVARASSWPGRKKSKMWSDLTEMQNFLMRLTLIRTFTAGIPMFGSGQDFVKRDAGAGQDEPSSDARDLAGAVRPRPNEMNKAVTRGEQGVQHLLRRHRQRVPAKKTRLRIHAVVDFRGSPSPGGGAYAGNAGNSGRHPRPRRQVSLRAKGARPVRVARPGSPDAILAATAPNPGGTIIYYRME